jgi:addiction module RelE/StbE family toxin
MKKIVWTEPAVDDLDAIHSYISRDSDVFANATILRILESVDRLEYYPLSGRIVPELGDEKMREILVGNYRIIYEVGSSAVTIQTVLHGARSFPHDLDN